MTKIKSTFVLSIIPLMLGCAAIGVMETKDPYRKLSDAYNLIWNLQRPLPGDTLILEAMEIFRQKRDEKGLAMAYTRYAELLGSPAAAQYERKGFQDGTPFAQRYAKSVEYLKMARELSVKNKDYEAVGNQDFKMAIAYETSLKIPEACAAYSQTVEDIKDYRKNVFDAKVYFPLPYKSFDEYIAAQKKRAGCS